ncbi:MAG: DUF167 domain-containing protein [bacterium]|nr:DUF167 domain-containing protein [bacterium]
MALVIDIKVVPRSGRNKWILDKTGKLKCYLKSAPEKGKANQELIILLAKALKVTQADITILSGATSRIKKIKIDSPILFDDLLTVLGIEAQRQLRVFD